MSDDQAFTILNTAPLLGWLALAFAPLRRRLMILIARIVAAVVAVAYVAMVVPALWKGGAGGVDLTTLGGIARAFSEPHTMLIGWAHYLALDLWTGTWEAEDAAGRVPHWALLPCLLLTLLAGPAGLALYLAIRTFAGRKVQAPS